ncbi:MAG: tRNA 4-thiouridine(8) synthase ThiI [Deltaproteobacteria bacterium]|nr:tRNA 4-thiouridine(8) synthase ThiI [Deltaproteobacteria bacterium]
MDHPQEIHKYTHLLCHYGELALKGRNRHRFEDRLTAMLAGKARALGVCGIHKLHGRVWIQFADPHAWERMAAIVRNTFGLANAHGMRLCDPTPAAIEETAVLCALETSFASFAVRCRRAEKTYPFTSQEICTRVGRAIETTTGARVHLTAPAWTCWIELTGGKAFVGAHRAEGPGGLPAGISGKVTALLSGGIDSPVAAWRMMRRGCEVGCVHFHSAPFTSSASKEKVLALVKALSGWQPSVTVTIVPFGRIQQEIALRAPETYRVILYRRLMLRIAAAIAKAEGRQALVTGEALGQVASQTLPNLATIDAASALPVLRPLIGMDKQEITNEAIRIGTYPISIEPHQDCCTYLEPEQPATRSTIATIDTIEAALDIPRLIALGREGAASHTFTDGQD